jgi:hypothetical protein
MASMLLPHESTEKEWDRYVWRANKEVPASLLRRLAEAADGIRNGEPIYYVAELAPDDNAGHDVLGYFESAEHAFKYPPVMNNMLLTSGRYMIFGPYRTDDDPNYRPKGIKEVILVPERGESVRLCGKKFDCVFWSLSAMDKFVIPYYASVGDLKKAKKVRDDFIEPVSIAGIHVPGSDIVNDATTATVDQKELRDRVGLYVMQATEGEDDPFVFIPL